MTDLNQGKFWSSLFNKILRILIKKLGISSTPDTHHQHVLPHAEGWAVKGEGNQKYTAIYKYQQDAIKRAKQIAENYRTDVIIHRKDGTIRDRISNN